MQPANCRIATPEFGEDFDQKPQPVAWLRVHHCLNDPLKPAALGKMVKDGLQQSTPRTKLIVDRQARHAGLLCHALNGEGGNGLATQKRRSFLNHSVAVRLRGRGSDSAHILPAGHLDLQT